MVEPSETPDRGWRDRWRQRRGRPPRTWVYRNLTPWRIYACYCDDGRLMSAEEAETDAGPRMCGECCRSLRSARSGCPTKTPSTSTRSGFVAAVRSTCGRRRASSGARCRALIVSLGLARRRAVLRRLGAALRRLERRAVGVVRGIARRRPGRRARGGDVPGDPPVSALRPLPERSSASSASAGRDAVARGHRARQPVPHVRRRPAAPGRSRSAVLIGAVRDRVVGLGVAIHQTTQLNELLPIDYERAPRVRRPVRRRVASSPRTARPSRSCSSATSPSGSWCRSPR